MTRPAAIFRLSRQLQSATSSMNHSAHILSSYRSFSRYAQNAEDPSTYNLLLRRYDTVPYYTALSRDNFSPMYHIVPCASDYFQKSHHVCVSNGLLYVHDLETDGIVWNPSNNQIKTLPPSSIQRLSDDFLHNAEGFCFDAETKDLKVMRWIRNYFGGGCGPCEVQGELYSFKNNSWKEISCPDLLISENSIFIRGDVYWLTCTGVGSFSLISFNFATESFQIRPLPKLKRVYAEHHHFLELGGRVGLVTYPRRGIEKDFEIWCMEGETWIKKSIIHSTGVYRFVGLWENHKLFFESLDHELLFYDGSTQTLKNLGIYGEGARIIHYAESDLELEGQDKW